MSIRRFCAFAFAFLLTGNSSLTPTAGAQKSPDVYPMKKVPVKFDKDYGAAIARIGEGRYHQVDATIVEIPPSGKLPPHKHLSEEAILIVSGKGALEMWIDNSGSAKKEHFEWKEGDLLSPTLNVWHQMINASPSEPARFLSVTTKPLLNALVPETAFNSKVEYPFADRWKKSLMIKDPRYEPSSEPGPETVRMKVGNLLPDVVNRQMRMQIADADPKSPRNHETGITINPEEDMASNRLLEMEVREFTKMEGTSPNHRHFWEVVYVALKGKIQSNLQREGEALRKVEWDTGDLLIVEAMEYHNHKPANVGARFLQIKTSGLFRRVGLDKWMMQNAPAKQ
jgi:quercetin dioxygenase-like cupin family protein